MPWNANARDMEHNDSMTFPKYALLLNCSIINSLILNSYIIGSLTINHTQVFAKKQPESYFQPPCERVIYMRETPSPDPQCNFMAMVGGKKQDMPKGNPTIPKSCL